MKTLEMEVALLRWIDIRKNLVVPNVSWGTNLHECDILSLSKAGYATEIEIKISKADLLKDKHKDHGHNSNLIKYLYFAVPKKLKEVALEEIPERAGLIVVSEVDAPDWFKGKYWIATRTVVERKPMVNKNAKKWNDKEQMNLARLGTMRILGLKQKLLR